MLKKKKKANRKINRILLLAAMPIAYGDSFRKLAQVISAMIKKER